MKNRLLTGGIVAALLFGVSCRSEPAVELPEGYAEQIELARQSRDERVRSDWMTLIGLHWLEEGDNAFGSAAGNAIVFPEGAGPEVAGKFVYEAGDVYLEAQSDAGVTVNGEPAGGLRLRLEPDTQQLGLGRLEFFVIERSGHHAIRVRDPQADTAKGFAGIDFYPIDATYVVEGALTRPESPRKVSVDTVLDRTAEMESRGTVTFELHGSTHTLEAMGSTSDLFLMFKDGTSGNETYPAGRYMSAQVNGDRVSLDFNTAYNPPCAFTPYATCPLPPPGNTIAARIEAGERAYHLEKQK